MSNTSAQGLIINEPRRQWSSLKGYVETTYDHIVSVLGPPMDGSDKTTAEWYIENERGLFATIYDYKEVSTPKEMYRWHVGGQSPLATDFVRDVLNLV